MAKSKSGWGAWQLWFHYVLLEGLIVLFFHLNGQHWIHSNIINLALLYVVIALGDQLIHLMLGALTGWHD